jgi:DNA repair protein RadC
MRKPEQSDVKKGGAESPLQGRQGIKNMAAADRPREKLKQRGAAALTDAELLTVLIQIGTREKSAMDLAQELLSRSRNRLSDLA